MINLRDKKSMTAIGYACKKGHLEAVKVLLEFKDKMTNQLPEQVVLESKALYMEKA